SGGGTGGVVPRALGGGGDVGRVQDAPVRAPRAAFTDTRRGGAGVGGVAAGPLCGTGTAAGVGAAGGCGSAAVVVRGGVEGAALSLAGGADRSGRPRGSATLVGATAGGGRRGSAAGAAQPHQPARHQTQDEQLEEEASAAPPTSSAHQALPRIHRH